MAGLIVGGLWEVIVVFGVHWGIVPIVLANFENYGYDTIQIFITLAVISVMTACFAVAVKSRNKEMKGIALSSGITAFFGITEPGIYGWTNSGIRFSKLDNPKKALYQAAHNEMVASAMVVRRRHEINPDFQIGCMLGFVPFYPYSCNPDDIMTAVESMHERFLFGDVMCRGHYGAYAYREWERENTAPEMEPGDAAILVAGTVDYVGFSYYMTNTVKADAADSGENVAGGNLHSVANPYVRVSDWGWAIDPVGLLRLFLHGSKTTFGRNPRNLPECVCEFEPKLL